MEDKYIGVVLAIASSITIGVSYIIVKIGLNEAGRKSKASDDLAYLKSPMWWAGMTIHVVGELANFAAYIFAPPILVTPLGALSVIVVAILASFFLGERLGYVGRLGCALCLLGSLVIVLHAPEDHPVETVDEILALAFKPGFLLYCLTVTVVSLVMVFVVGPKHGRTNPLVYLTVCSLVGSASVMAIKAFGIALKLTLAGNNQFTHISTYVFGVIVPLCIIIQMNYLNKALDLFSTNVVNPIYYVLFSSSTIAASIILFQGLYETNIATGVSLIVGFLVTFLGVHLLNISRTPETGPLDGDHISLESGMINPRLSLQGRASSGGWTDTHIPGHTRRGSLYRNRDTTLFDALDERDDAGENIEAVAIHRLPEEEDEDENENDDERTHLRWKGPATSPGLQSGGSTRSKSQGMNPSLVDVSIPT